MEQGVLRMAKGLLERDRVAAGAGTALGWAGDPSAPGPFQSHRCHLGQRRGQRHRETADGDAPSPTAGRQTGGSPAAPGGPPGCCAQGKPPAPPPDAGARAMAWPRSQRAQRDWAGPLVWRGAAGWPGSPVPAGRCLAAGQCCPAARGPQSSARHCQQAACCLLDSEIWPQLARIQFNYDKQRLHPLSRD